MNFRNKTTRTKPALNITPLLDMVFILLIFFAVNTTFMAAGTIDVDLPETESSHSDQKEESLTVAVTKDGVYKINGRIIVVNELKDELKTASGKYKILVVEADKEAAHGQVVKVIDYGKLAGFEQFAIATEDESHK